MRLTYKQTQVLDLLEDKVTNEIIFGGGAGGAKSFVGCYWILKNALKYPATRWLIGRKKLKTLKETTLNTFIQVAKMQGLVSGEHYLINHSSNIIKIIESGSEILLKDLAYYPADPDFDELGSLEITGAFIDEVNQCVSKAWTIVRSRIRYKLDEHNLVPKILGTCNPSKGFIYKDFYLPNKLNTLPTNKVFIQSLVTDNPYISKHYVEILKALPPAQRDRLFLGMWEIDDASALIEYDNIMNIFSNVGIKNLTKKYITCDVARLGSDKAIIIYWEGLKVVEILQYDVSKITELSQAITQLRIKYNVPLSNIIADEDGVGGGLVDILNITGFVNNSSALNGENYKNLKTQCYYKLAEIINAGELWLAAELEDIVIDEIVEELEQVKSDNTGDDSKLRIISKDQVKLNIGRSPDYSDALIDRKSVV